MSFALYEEPFEPGAFGLVLVGARLAAPFVREEPFLLAPPRWEVFATQLPFSPFNGHLDLRDPAWRLLADKRVEASLKYT